MYLTHSISFKFFAKHDLFYKGNHFMPFNSTCFICVNIIKDFIKGISIMMIIIIQFTNNVDYKTSCFFFVQCIAEICVINSPYIINNTVYLFRTVFIFFPLCLHIPKELLCHPLQCIVLCMFSRML